MIKDEIRNLLSNNMQKLFDDIDLSKVLGANKQIELISTMLLSIADNEKLTKLEIRNNIINIAEYYQNTRGQNSRAIYNAISIFLSNLDFGLDKDEMIKKFKSGLEEYEKNSQINAKAIVEYASSISENFKTIMIFDYSSTINEYVKGLKSKKTIFIPESRALNGGKPFVETAIEYGHNVRFIPDTTIYHHLQSCDAAFMGAETIYPDGTVFNTIGSDIMGVCCKDLGIPFFTLTPLIKVDVRPIYGHIRLSPMNYDFSTRLANDWDSNIKEKIDFTGVKLVSVKPEYITAIICENGIIPNKAFYQIALDYNRKLEENICLKI